MKKVLDLSVGYPFTRGSSYLITTESNEDIDQSNLVWYSKLSKHERFRFPELDFLKFTKNIAKV